MDFDSAFKAYLKQHFLNADSSSQRFLRKSLFYSLTAEAGRFRPKLCFAATKALGENPKKILPWAIAIEMIHTASLIHDDLPLMDNAQMRRRLKCNHLVFGEDIALLAGACLFVESFSLLKAPVFHKKRTQILNLLVSKIGFQGLMGGQALDLQKAGPSRKHLLKTIRLKTGSLITACVLAPLILWRKKGGKGQSQTKILTDYSENLGIAYQLADDLQDRDFSLRSKKWIKKEFQTAISRSLAALKPLGSKGAELKALNHFVQKRAPECNHLKA